MSPSRVPLPASCAGFTMLELIIVILIAGILSFMAIGRLNDTGEVNAHGFAEQIASTLRFAQEAAVAQRRLLYVNVNAGTGVVNACLDSSNACAQPLAAPGGGSLSVQAPRADRKSTRLNSSHANISYAVFCLKKKSPNSKSASLRP